MRNRTMRSSDTVAIVQLLWARIAKVQPILPQKLLRDGEVLSLHAHSGYPSRRQRQSPVRGTDVNKSGTHPQLISASFVGEGNGGSVSFMAADRKIDVLEQPPQGGNMILPSTARRARCRAAKQTTVPLALRGSRGFATEDQRPKIERIGMDQESAALSDRVVFLRPRLAWTERISSRRALVNSGSFILTPVSRRGRFQPPKSLPFSLCKEIEQFAPLAQLLRVTQIFRRKSSDRLR